MDLVSEINVYIILIANVICYITIPSLNKVLYLVSILYLVPHCIVYNMHLLLLLLLLLFIFCVCCS